MILGWLQVDRYHLESDCQRFTITRSRSTVSGEFVYLAFKRVKGHPPVVVDRFDSVEAAKAACEAQA